MKEYHKINTIFKRDLTTNKLLYGQWSQPEFEYLANNEWLFTEKVDGTNIRIMFDGEQITFGGKSDKAEIPRLLLSYLDITFTPKFELFTKLFIKDDKPAEVCLYGEGYGGNIQKAGKLYNPTPKFVLFDVWVNGWWLNRPDVEQIAKDLDIEVVPLVGQGTLFDCIRMVKDGYKSAWGDFTAEGLVVRPVIELKQRGGTRIIAKIKHRDFAGLDIVMPSNELEIRAYRGEVAEMDSRDFGNNGLQWVNGIDITDELKAQGIYFQILPKKDNNPMIGDEND